jgi:cation transport ATPase
MSPEKISALISLLVAITVIVFSFFQWWDVTWDGRLPLKKWVKVIFIVCLCGLLISTALIFF